MPNDNNSQLLPAVAAGIPIVGSVINAVSQGVQNKKARQFAERMYNTQRSDALADWRMQNDYNSPAAQMARLKSAGLNPNLVYGNGAEATSSSMPRAAQSPGWAPHAPQVDLSGVQAGLFAGIDMKMKQAQYNNLETQRELMEQEAKNKAAMEFKIYADTMLSASKRDLTDTDVQLKGVDLNYAARLKEMSLEGMRASISKTLQDTKLSAANTAYRISENERQELKTGMTLKQGAERILLLRKQQALTEANTEVSQQRKSQLIQQTIEIDRRIERLRGEIKQSDEKARLLESTPDWGDQRSLEMLQGILNTGMGNLTRPGSMYNPRTSETNFQRIQIKQPAYGRR